MNDKLIINTISKIHFIIVSFVLFILVLSISLFIMLQNGIHIQGISIPQVQVKQLYIKWDEKLSLNIDKIEITQERGSGSLEIDDKKINKLFQNIIAFENWFSSIDIKSITYDDIHAKFKYSEETNGLLQINSPRLVLESKLYFEGNLFNIHISKLHDKARRIKAQGNIILHAKNPEIVIALDTNINNDIHFDLNALVTNSHLLYDVDFKKTITHTQHTINLFGLDKDILYWITDAIDMQQLDIKNTYGWIDFQDMANGYKNLYVDSTFQKLNYTYNENIEAVASTHTDVVFKNGALYIKPQNATSYGFDLEQSWLKIDFTTPKELLTLYLNFDGQLNDDILHILNVYGIKLPLKQNSGTIRANLQLDLILNGLDTTVVADFFAQKANISYLGLDIDVEDAYVKLNNTDVEISDMSAFYKDIASAQVDLKLNTKHLTGYLDFTFDKIEFQEQGVKLVNTPLNAKYIIGKKQDIIESKQKMHFLFLDKEFILDPVEIPFSVQTLIGTIPTTYLQSKDGDIKAYTSGSIDLDKLEASFEADLFHFDFANIVLDQSNTFVNVTYKEELKILADKVDLVFDGIDIHAKNIDVAIDNERMNFNNLDFIIHNQIKGLFTGDYYYIRNIGKFSIADLHVFDKSLGDIFKSEQTISLLLEEQDKFLKIAAPKLKAVFTQMSDKWSLLFRSLDTLEPHSDLLERFSLNNGSFEIYKMQEEKEIKYEANINFPYKLLTKNNTPTDQYTVTGSFDDAAHFSVNDTVHVSIGKEINIDANNTGVDIGEVIRFVESQPDSNSSESTNIFAHAKNSYVYINEGRYALADSMEFQFFNDIVTAQLKHEKGTAGFRYENDEFHLYGEKFGDTFMESLFVLSQFKGGELSFSMSGAVDDYNGVIFMSDTTIVDYKILNNLLAFINTIPSLVTFSLPGYSTKGLYVDHAYMNFQSKGDQITITDFFLDSKEMDIVAKGDASIVHNSVDMQVNLITDLGSTLSQVPAVGYILLNGDSLSTSLSVTGELDNPKIDTLIAKEIIVAPLNIIKRTLLLPYHLITGEK